MRFPKPSDCAIEVGVYLINRAQYTESEIFYHLAIAIGEKTLGPEHLDLAIMFNNLANLYYYQGKYEEAEPLYQRAIAIGEKTLGPEHPGLTTWLHNLAFLYANQGKYAEAEPLFQQAIAIFEKVLGLTHPSTIVARENYTALLRQWKKEEGE